MTLNKIKIGFIGQGWIGKNYADNFESRGFDVVRYSLLSEHIKNKELIKLCDIVFIAVPTPTTSKGFDSSVVEAAISLVGKGKIAVIKSTILPGTTEKLQKKYKDKKVFYSPEFLSEATAKKDVETPFSNIIGIPKKSSGNIALASKILNLLPKAPFELVCTSTEAEIIKYTHNASGYFQIMLFNAMYDIANRFSGDWNVIKSAIDVDPLICNRYSSPLHKSGRGAGGNCFIKDFAALRELYGKILPKDLEGIAMFKALEKKNIKLLKQSKKDLNLLRGVYGDKV
jgi:nucleotide sugar dehydrogenase